jgi:hypothetical protein
MYYNNESLSLLPSVEELYDMDIDCLKKLKEDIEKRGSDEKEGKRWRKIYKYVVSELKEREHIDNVLDFFMNQHLFDEFIASTRDDDYIPRMVKEDSLKNMDRPIKIKSKVKKLNPIKKNIDNKKINKKCCKSHIIPKRNTFYKPSINKNEESKFVENIINNNQNKTQIIDNNSELFLTKENCNNINKEEIENKIVEDNQETKNDDTSLENTIIPITHIEQNLDENILSEQIISEDINNTDILINNKSISIKSKPKITIIKKKLIPIDKNKLSNTKLELIETIEKPIKVEYIDYTKIFPNLNQIFNGFYYNKKFNYLQIIERLIFSFQNLCNYNRDTDYDKVNINIVNAETEIIKDRIRKVSDKLLYDQAAFSEDNFFIFKKMLELEKKKYAIRESDNKSSNLFYRVVVNAPDKFDIFSYTLGLREDWRELPHGLNLGQTWNILWTYSFPTIDYNCLFVWQKVNHFINNKTLSRKDLLKKAITKIYSKNRKTKAHFNIMPLTFILSREYMEFVDEYKRLKNNKDNKWIVKPIGKSRGNGIFIPNDISEVPNVDSYLVQKYITNPLLLDGFKFDMRIYVLVTSFNRLEAFIYKEGFARMSNYLFSLSAYEREIHLTNAAIQNKIALNSNEHLKLFGGSKISLEMLRDKLNKKNIKFDPIWVQIKDIVLKSLIACELEIPNSPSSFELFGYDIIIDTNLKCWLLEINTSPSLERNCVLDDQIKLQLMDNIIDIVNPIDFDKQSLIDFLYKLMKNYNNDEFNTDMMKILKGHVPRKYGDIPNKLGNFEMISPSHESEKIIKLISM